MPNGSGEKAKGAILSRAVQYIHHLKENEARNIEKWTLEKLLMDQAMGDLQAQLEEVRRAWDEERAARQRLENEIAVLRGIHGTAPASGSPPSRPTTSRSVGRSFSPFSGSPSCAHSARAAASVSTTRRLYPRFAPTALSATTSELAQTKTAFVLVVGLEGRGTAEARRVGKKEM